MRILAIPVLLLLFFPTGVAGQAVEGSMVFLGASNTNKGYNPLSYVDMLPDQGDPWKTLDLLNSGVDGAGAFTYYENSTLLSSKLHNYEPDIIFIMLGGNDFLNIFLSPEVFNEQIGWLLETIRDNTQVPIFLANIIWSPLEVVLPSSQILRFNKFQAVLKDVSDYSNVFPVDVFNTTQGQTSYYEDPIHLNEEGHQAVAATIHDQIAEKVIDLLTPDDSPIARWSFIIGIAVIVVMVTSYPFLKRKYT